MEHYAYIVESIFIEKVSDDNNKQLKAMLPTKSKRTNQRKLFDHLYMVLDLHILTKGHAQKKRQTQAYPFLTITITLISFSDIDVFVQQNKQAKITIRCININGKRRIPLHKISFKVQVIWLHLLPVAFGQVCNLNISISMG